MSTNLSATDQRKIAVAEAAYKASPTDANREALRDLYDWLGVDDFERMV